MRDQLASLPPLRVSSVREGITSDASSGSLYRKTDLLLNNLLKMSAGVKVVDITGKTPGLSLSLSVCNVCLSVSNML